MSSIIILLVTLTSWIWLPALIIIVAVHLSRKSNGTTTNNAQTSINLNEQWDSYIRDFQRVVRTKAEKNLITAILTRKTPDELYSKTELVVDDSSVLEANQRATDQPARGIQTDLSSAPQASQVISQPKLTTQQIDGTTLLLYFGAFLLVAAAGLFVAIGTFSGVVRTAVLAITVAGLYLGGLWLYQNKSKLAKAGMSFMGTGLIIAPLIGVAFYNLVANQTNGAAIWLVTSLVCLGLYIHALTTLRSSFVSYLLIGSFVSTIEASVLMINLPSYAFAWGLIVAGVIVVLANRGQRDFIKLTEAGDVSSQVLTPLSIIGSLVMIDEFGSWQLGITLMLAALYYSLLAWHQAKNRRSYILVSQFTGLAAIASFSYSFSQSWGISGLVLATIGLIYGLVIASLDSRDDLNYGLSSVALAVVVFSTIFSLARSDILWFTLLSGVMILAIIWLRRVNQAALAASGLLTIILALVVGQYSLSPTLDIKWQLAASALASLLIYLVVIASERINRLKFSGQVASVLFIVSILPLVIMAWLIGFVWLFVLAVVITVLSVILSIITNKYSWLFLAGLIGFVPILASFSDGQDYLQISVAIFTALGVNILISLSSRQAAQRWLLMVAILLTPVAIAGGGLGFKWGLTGFSLLYLVAMAGCMLARAVARGKLLFSSTKPILGYEKVSSVAYVVGYVISASTAVIISLGDANSQVLTTVVLGLVCLAVFVLAYVIENTPRVMMALPILLQLVVLSGSRPDARDGSIYVTFAALVLTAAAGLVYLTMEKYQDSLQSVYRELGNLTVVTSYFGALIAASYWLGAPKHISGTIFPLLPISLMLAGILTVYHNQTKKQSVLEASIGVIIVSYHWILYLLGIDNIHVHTHLLALALAGFAYWRWYLGDREASQKYVTALFLVSTIPLVLQALGGESGGVYGLALIVQQVFFMVIGIFSGQRFLIRAGLWVAIAAVLYQLRGLGWAFVGLIAVILIAIAVYRLQYYSDQNR